MTSINPLKGWHLPEEIVTSTKAFITGHQSIAKDSEEIVSPVFEDREMAFDWLKDEARRMNGNALIDLKYSDINDKGVNWFSGRVVLVAKHHDYKDADAAVASRHYARDARNAFYKEQTRVQQEREEERAEQARIAEAARKRKTLFLRCSLVVGTLLAGSGLVYALPL